MFVPCATHGHRMIHKQMKHVSNKIVKIERIEFVFLGVFKSDFEFISFYT